MKRRVRLLTMLVIAPGASVIAADRLPYFSWDRVPLYAHFGYDTNLTPALFDFVAKRFPLVTNAAHNWRESGAPLKPSLGAVTGKTAAFMRQHDRGAKP